ncbi:hypothetical protein D3C75_942530 [compost metagenome]
MLQQVNSFLNQIASFAHFPGQTFVKSFKGVEMADCFLILVREALMLPPLGAYDPIAIGSPFRLDIDHSIAVNHLLQIASGEFPGIRDKGSDRIAAQQQLCLQPFALYQVPCVCFHTCTLLSGKGIDPSLICNVTVSYAEAAPAELSIYPVRED